MLKPFQIRDLRVSGQELGDSHSPSGVVQISSTDYDDLATNHPRARLTYTDEDEDSDDDETITVSLQYEHGYLVSSNLTIYSRLDLLSSSLSALKSLQRSERGSNLSKYPTTPLQCISLTSVARTL